MKMLFEMNDIMPNDVLCVIQDGDEETRKTIAYEDFLCMVDAEAESDQMIPRIGRLPEGFVDGGVGRDGSKEAIIRVPAGRRPLIFAARGGNESSEYIVPFPELIFHFKTKGNRVIKSEVCACVDGLLYHYPFGNVYDDAHICWGSNTLPAIESMKQFETLVTLFFSSGTNNDLFRCPVVEVPQKKKDGTPSKKTKKLTLTQKDLLEVVSKAETFPVSLLARSGKKISDLQ